MSTTGKNQGLFNNAAQVFNHSFYWLCMKKVRALDDGVCMISSSVV